MPSAVSTVSVRTRWRRFCRNRRGSAAVEFALVAPVFLALLFAVFETAIIFFAGQVLETVTQDSARMISTGQAQNLSYDATAFRNNVVCPRVLGLGALFDCTNGGIYIDVQNYNSSFSNIVINSQIDSNGNFINNMQYNPGGPCNVVVVRLFYQWPLFVTGLGYDISNLTGHKRLLSATAAFKNEPYNGSCP
jgi:Flp pilus assembly protein TadG